MRDVLLPASLSELWAMLDEHPMASVYAGGTDLLVKMRSGLIAPRTLICLERIEELRSAGEQGGTVRIGSCVTHAQLLADSWVRAHLPVLVQALKVLGSPLIRNMGTLGGNICTASPAGDTLPPLYVLDAEVELRSEREERRMPIREFITGPGVTRLKEGEILTAVRVPKPAPKSLHHFEKVGLRNALGCSVVSLAALVERADGGLVERASLAWGSVGPTIVSCPDAESVLLGRRLSLEALKEAGAIVREAVSPISDVRASADYRRTVSGNLLLRLAHVEQD